MAVSPRLATEKGASAALDGRVATVVVTHDGIRFVGKCLRALREVDPAGEVVVIDNASRDGTAELVRREWPEVRVEALGTNIGYGAAVNRAARLVEHEYLAVVNQDVEVERGWLGPLVAGLEADPGAVLATPKVVLTGEPERINAFGNSPQYTGITVCRRYRWPAEAVVETEVVAAISGAAFVARRAAFLQLGGFDPLFFLYLEDTDLSLRAGLAGYRCLAVGQAVVRHDFEPRFGPDKLGHLERNRHLLLLKLYRWPTLVLLAPPLVLTELLVLGYSLARGPRCLGAKVAGYAWLARRLATVWRERRGAQRLRRVQDRTLIRGCAADLTLDELGHPLGRLATRLANPFYRAWWRLAGAVIRW